MKFTPRARTALRRVARGKTVRLTLLASATDGQKRKVSRTKRITLKQ